VLLGISLIWRFLVQCLWNDSN